MARVKVTPIAESDLPAVGRFLHEHLNRRIVAEVWSGALTHPWCEARPNYGVQAHDGERLVGVFCAIYSDQVIDGKVEKFCNPHSWCMLEEYRGDSVSLPLHLIRQKGFHFTMLTPNPKVAEIFLHLGFKNLADEVLTFPNLPALRLPGRDAVCTDVPERIAACLPEAARRDFAAHRDIPWLSFVAFGRGEDTCLVVWKRERWKKLPCARIIGISDPAAFDRHFDLLAGYFMRRGVVTSRAERRFLAAKPRLARSELRRQHKLWKSDRLTDTQIRDLYSELAALPL